MAIRSDPAARPLLAATLGLAGRGVRSARQRGAAPARGPHLRPRRLEGGQRGTGRAGTRTGRPASHRIRGPCSSLRWSARSTRSGSWRVPARRRTSADITPRAEHQFRLVLVVAAAAERDVLDGSRSSLGIRPDVMELEEGALGAPPSVGGNERTLPVVAARDRALHVSRDIARRENGCSELSIRRGTDRTRPRLRGRTQLRLLDFLEQKPEGAVEDRAGIAVRYLAAEKGLDAPKSVVALLADRELHAIALGRRRLDDRTASRSGRSGDRRRRFDGATDWRLNADCGWTRRRDGRGSRQLADGAGDIGAWRQLRHQRLDLP